MQFNLSTYFFLLLVLLMSQLRSHCLGQGHKDLSLFSFKSFTVLSLRLRSLIYFELIFFVCCKVKIHLYFFVRGYTALPTPFVENCSFPNEYRGALVENRLTVFVKVSFQALYFIPLVSLSLCQFHTVLITVALCSKFWNWEM